MNNEKIDKMNAPGELRTLLQLAIDYKKSQFFLDMMSFCNKMRHLNPYNAMLVYIQMPGSRYTLSAGEWKKYGRILKPNAKPILILNFQPVGFVYDISDTMEDPESNVSKSVEYMLNELETMNSIVSMKKDCVDFDILYRNINMNGIAIDDQMNAGSTFSAKIERLKYPIDTKLDVKKGLSLVHPLPYLLSVNIHASKGETIASIFHELGHLFCCHMSFPEEWTEIKNILSSKVQFKFEPWDVRHISYEAREIEAECVAWIVCSRLGIVTKSEMYIASYLIDNEHIPDGVDYHSIFNAANKILSFVKRENYKETLLYKYDALFRKIVKNN